MAVIIYEIIISDCLAAVIAVRVIETFVIDNFTKTWHWWKKNFNEVAELLGKKFLTPMSMDQ